MVASQQDELQRIFNGINDIIQLNVFSKSSFDDHIDHADKERKDTIDAVINTKANLSGIFEAKSRCL